MAATTPPLSLGEILDRTVQLYRRNFALFVGVALLPSALDVLVSGVSGVYMSAQLPNLQTAGAPPNMQAMLIFFLVLAVFFLVGVPILLGVFAVAFSALNFAATQRNHGMPATVRESYGYAFRYFWRHVGIFFLQVLLAGVVPGSVFAGILFIGAMLIALIAATGAGKVLTVLFGILMFGLGVAVIVVSIWIWLRFSLAYPASFAEGKKAWASLQRSAQLTKGSRGRIFVMYVLVTILTIVAYYALTLPLDIVLKLTVYKAMPGIALMTKPPLVLQVVNLCISFLERSLVMPIQAIALLLFYNDQRTRQEGYDIELLMAQAGWGELPPAAALPVAEEPGFVAEAGNAGESLAPASVEPQPSVEESQEASGLKGTNDGVEGETPKEDHPEDPDA
jgi:hypothetical protein